MPEESRCYRDALTLLKRGLKTRLELARKLDAKGHSEADIEQTIARLEAVGFVNDARLADDRAQMAVGRAMGRHKVERKLADAGVDDAAVRASVDRAYDPVDEARMARELLQARLPQYRRVDAPTAHRRAIGFLLRRGFSEDITQAAVTEVLGEPPEVWE
jgi:SOS response regulatory protein OraA/RecX